MNSYKAYTLSNFKQIPQLRSLDPELIHAIEVVGHVLPFKTNNYVCDELINWNKVPTDPIFILTFPQKQMLSPLHFIQMAEVLKSNDRELIKETANEIRLQLNPHPAGQMEHNVPQIDGVKLTGMQHKYRQTVLFFPAKGQTCHAYCTFCFRWPQFVGMNEWKFAMHETELLVSYLRNHPEVTDVLFTGGDPMIMKTKMLAAYIEPLLETQNIPHLQTIRIGTKALGYWPQRFLFDDDADELIDLFERIVRSGKNLAIMAHFNHPVELSTPAVKTAIQRIRATGAQIRTQSPLLKNINDSPEVWADMWRKQVNLNCIPYYMFLARDTGAQDYFAVPLVKAWEIFRKAYQQVSGVCRTVRGPSMSCTPGKVQVLGVSEIPMNGKSEKIITLRFLQGRNPDWAARPFFAKYDEKATWLDDLKPAFGEKEFFFENELEELFSESIEQTETGNFE
jgi:KamA family protein